MLGKNKDAQKKGGPETKDWYRDKHQYVLVQRNILALITLVALGVALISVFAIMQLTPQKTVEPFVVKIDEKTGMVQEVRQASKSEFMANEVVDNYFVVKYVRSRETYDLADLRDSARTVGLMSDPTVYGSYRRHISPNNPDSPAAILKNTGQRVVKFKSISYLNNASGGTANPRAKTVQVRITLQDTMPQVRQPIEYHRVITLQFEYADLGLEEQERHTNPLGFLVTSYRSDRDAAL